MEQDPGFKLEHCKKKVQGSRKGSFHITLQNENLRNSCSSPLNCIDLPKLHITIGTPTISLNSMCYVFHVKLLFSWV